MSSTSLKIVGVPSASPQRGARWGAALFVAAWQGVAGLFSVRQRSATRAEEAAEVREMARHLASSDPGFAADLMAAADRHESGQV